MTAVFTIALVAGAVGMLARIALAGLGSVDLAGWDPAAAVIAGALGFGLGGLSAHYAGWPALLALAAGVVAGAGVAWLGRVWGASP